MEPWEVREFLDKNGFDDWCYKVSEGRFEIRNHHRGRIETTYIYGKDLHRGEEVQMKLIILKQKKDAALVSERS